MAERYLPAPEEAGRICDAGPAGSCGSRGVLRCRTGRRRKGRPHIEKPYVSEAHDCFYFWNVIPWSLHFLSVPDGKKTKQKKGQPPRHSGLKISPVTTLRATRSLRSLRQALRLTPPAKFSPFGHRPPFKGAGNCTSAGLISCMRCGLHFRCECFSYTDTGPHRAGSRSLHARRRFVSRASTLPYANEHAYAGAGPHTIKKLSKSYAKVNPANATSHTHARSAADRARLCRAFFFPIRRRKAPRKCPAQPDSSFPLRPCAARRKKSACGHSFPRGREYRFPLCLSPAPKPGSSSGAAF